MTTQGLRPLTRASTTHSTRGRTAPATFSAADIGIARGSQRQSRRTSQARQPLQVALRAGDAIAIFLGFAVPLLIVASFGPQNSRQAIVEAGVLVAVGMWSMRVHGLWTAQVTTVRSIEISRLFRAVVTLAAIALLIDRKLPTNLRFINLVFAGSVALVALVLWRSVYRAYLNAERRRGRCTMAVAVVGTGRHANDLSQLFLVHPELGMRVTTVIGEHHEAAASGMADLWKGTYDQASDLLSSAAVDVVVLCSTELDRGLLNHLSAQARACGHTLFIDPGLSGIDFKRVHTTAIGYQPLLEMSPASLSGVEATIKRVFDVVVSSVIAFLAAPVMLVIALTIKLEDRGPVLYRQQRVGRDGRLFEMLKFRSMVVDADERLAALEAANERKGPLFKMDQDPRITRIGRFLRATSLDELPQLFNVLAGTMSLVGPRPALPREVAEFPEELNARHQVRPGITGLWQVEARDNPSFEAYIRLDLFYVQNWTLATDFFILLGTLDHIVLRPLIKLMYRREDELRRQADLRVASGAAAVQVG
jgi:exopolysaccharide biosynthesis polyprenyl glycosylphosphotransferase